MKYVYLFGDGKADGKADMKNLLGGKGANLAEMNILGIPVPPGFTLTTEVCTEYYKNDKSFPEGLNQEVNKSLSEVESIMGTSFGDTDLLYICGKIVIVYSKRITCCCNYVITVVIQKHFLANTIE